jgi:hypothetical protein
MLKRLPVALFAALIFAVSTSASVLATASPASADQDDHANRGHHAHRAPNPYGANGYWSNGAWHNRLANNGWHGNNPKRHGPKHRKVHGDHDRR